MDVETESKLLFGTTVADFRSLWGKPANAHVVSWNDPETGFAELVEQARRPGPAAGAGRLSGPSGWPGECAHVG